MLFLLISNPHPSKPEEVKKARLEFWSWIGDWKAKGKVICVYPRVGRGVVIIVDVSSHEELHQLMTQWSNLVPASFEVYPLITPSEAEKILKS